MTSDGGAVGVCDPNVPALEIGFNPAFLADALRAIPYEKIGIELHESFRPGVLRGSDKTEFLYVVMPVSLSA